jgi:hypothetical protein
MTANNNLNNNLLGGNTMDAIKSINEAINEISTSNEIKVYMVGIEEPGAYDALYIVGNQENILVYHINYFVKKYKVDDHDYIYKWAQDYNEYKETSFEPIADILVNKYITLNEFLEHLTYAEVNYNLNI